MTDPTQAGWAIELIGVGKSYCVDWRGRTADALVDLTLRVRPGQVLGLLGPNGSGKSTALKILAGLIRPTTGTCLIGGALAGSQVARAQIGYLPETPRYAPHLTGRGLLRYVAALSGVPATTVGAQVDALLAEHELAVVADQRIGTYSKGQRQRLGLAQARVHDPAVLLLDEPASGLDPAGRRALGRRLRQEAAQGRTVVFSSHLLTQAEAICDRIALLDRGRLLAEGSPSELLGVAVEEELPPSRLERFYLETLPAHA